MTRRPPFHRAAAVLMLGTVALVSTSCGEVARTGRAPALLIIDNLEASQGEESEFSNFLLSDVVTNGGVFNDNGRASFRLALKNPGTPASPLSPSTLNEITLTRYHVRYLRADGRSTPGVDVPHDFAGALTVTVTGQGGTQATFVLVRHQAKREPPLRNMWEGGGTRFLSVIAEITFYGRDLAGNDVQATGNISINFADYADPE
jgi:hypothetical protein